MAEKFNASGSEPEEDPKVTVVPESEKENAGKAYQDKMDATGQAKTDDLDQTNSVIPHAGSKTYEGRELKTDLSGVKSAVLRMSEAGDHARAQIKQDEEARLAMEAHQQNHQPSFIAGIIGAIGYALRGGPSSSNAGVVNAHLFTSESDVNQNGDIIAMREAGDRLMASSRRMDETWGNWTADAQSFVGEGKPFATTSDLYVGMASSSIPEVAQLNKRFEENLKGPSGAALNDYTRDMDVFIRHSEGLSAKDKNGMGEAHAAAAYADHIADSIKSNHPIMKEDSPESTEKKMKELTDSIMKFIDGIANAFKNTISIGR